MENSVAFTFAGSTHSCDVFIDSAADPDFIFVVLESTALIKLYGTDITIKTDFEKFLPEPGDNTAINELRKTIFSAMTLLPAFIAAKKRKSRINELKQNRTSVL